MDAFRAIVVGVLVIASGCAEQPGKTTAGANAETAASSTELAAAKESESNAVKPTVRQDYAKLRAALERGDGKTAATLVSADTIALYDNCRSLAVSAPESTLRPLDQMSVVLVLQLRYLLPKQELQTMTGADLFAWGVEKGLLKKNTVEGIDITGVEFNGSRAAASLTKAGKPLDSSRFDFVQEDNHWKLDMLPIIDAGNVALEAARAESGGSRVDLAMDVLTQTYNKPMPPEILQGPLR
jgi:hypothetical protein